jgi:hypothetical protein
MRSEMPAVSKLLSDASAELARVAEALDAYTH